MPESSDLKLDALYTIFEQHLYNVEEESTDDETEDAFIARIVIDYVKFLSTQKVIIPKRWQRQIFEELHEQVRSMLRKKMYGCLSVSEFIRGQGAAAGAKKKTARKKYRKLY